MRKMRFLLIPIWVRVMWLKMKIVDGFLWPVYWTIWLLRSIPLHIAQTAARILGLIPSWVTWLFYSCRMSIYGRWHGRSKGMCFLCKMRGGWLRCAESRHAPEQEYQLEGDENGIY